MTPDTTIDLEISVDVTMGFLSPRLQALSVGSAASLPTAFFFPFILHLASVDLLESAMHLEEQAGQSLPWLKLYFLHSRKQWKDPSNCICVFQDCHLAWNIKYIFILPLGWLHRGHSLQIQW